MNRFSDLSLEELELFERLENIHHQQLIQSFKDTDSQAINIEDVNILKYNNEILECEIYNTTLPYMKTLRDIMFRDIPTMAIDKIYIGKNTGILPYELLSNRIADIPIYADATKFEYISVNDYNSNNFNEDNTLTFTITKHGPSGFDIIDPLKMNVYSGDLKWKPVEEQETKFKENPIKVSTDTIVITKLLPGQTIDLECYAFKGTGKQHSKFEPVSVVIFDEIGTKTMVPYVPKWEIESMFSKENINKLTISEYIKVFRRQNYKLTIEAIGQMNPIDILKQGLEITNNYINLPYSERVVDIEIPGYYY